MQTPYSPERLSFLEHHWPAFPPAAKPQKGISLQFGRILQVSEGQVTIESATGERLTFEIGSDFEFHPNYLLTAVLVPGDLIQVTTGAHASHRIVSGSLSKRAKAITLLVPAQGENLWAESVFDRQRAVQWQKFMTEVRSFFNKRDFIELRTPTLVPSPGLEPFLDPFKTIFKVGREVRDFYLPTSPEFHLKKALTRGFDKIFEFKECFRNGELSLHHQPEFLMLEWYRAFVDNDALIEDVKELINGLQEVFSLEKNLGPVSVITMPALWKQALDFALTPRSTLEDLKGLARSLKIEVGADENFDDLFALIFLEKIEPFLKEKKVPVIVQYYPPSQAALARLTEDGWADRFELYWRGFEIANAFHELNDVGEQGRRFTEDQKKKIALGKEIVPIDEEFMKALRYGLPPSAGIALGVERLFMALMNLDDIAAARMFAVKL